MRICFSFAILFGVAALPALAQGQHRTTHSPYYNVHHNDSVLTRQIVAEQHLHPLRGHHYAGWSSDFIISGVPGYYYDYYEPYVVPRVHRHVATCYWVEGHYELVQRKVWVPARIQREYVPPAYSTVLVDGQPRAVLVSQGYYREKFIPSHYETYADYAWVPGYWSCGS